MKMKEVLSALLLCSAVSNAAKIVGGGTAAGAAGGGATYSASGVFFGPFWAADVKIVGAAGVPVGPGAYGVCNANDVANMGTCLPVGSCATTTGGEVVGDCSEYGPGAAKSLECCMAVVTCGMTVQSGIAYFRNPNYPEPEKGSLSCNIKIDVMPNVGQLRFDFLEFELPAPDKKTGVCSNKDSMSIMAPQMPLGVLGRTKGKGGFCGLNGGQHVYVPVVGGEQVQVVTTLTGYGSVPFSRASLAHDRSSAYKWNIMITQIETGPEAFFMKDLAAEPGCLQYFKESYGKITTFNFDGYSAIAPNQDYAICIRPDTPMSKGLTLRSTVFKMPTGGSDAKYCASGKEIVNAKTTVDCCLHPSSSYMGVTAWQPYSMQKFDEKAVRRYWCGENLGTEGQISTEDFTIKVFTGENYECEYSPVGFEVEYKVDVGI